MENPNEMSNAERLYAEGELWLAEKRREEEEKSNRLRRSNVLSHLVDKQNEDLNRLRVKNTKLEELIEELELQVGFLAIISFLGPIAGFLVGLLF